MSLGLFGWPRPVEKPRLLNGQKLPGKRLPLEASVILFSGKILKIKAQTVQEAGISHQKTDLFVKQKNGSTHSGSAKGVGASTVSGVPIINDPEEPSSASFFKQVEQALLSMPAVVYQAAANFKSKIFVGHFLTDIFPDLKQDVSEGWDDRGWDQIDGVNWGQDVGLAEYSWTPPTDEKAQTYSTSSIGSQHRLKRSQKLKTVDSDRPGYILERTNRPDRVLRHELGHVFDSAALSPGFSDQQVLEEDIALSASPAFIAAHQQDVTALTETEKKEFQYFIQPDETSAITEVGRQEAFAEALASLTGGGCYKAAAFQKRFKHTTRYVKQWVEGLELQRLLNEGKQSGAIAGVPLAA